ncbi:MAG: hypothetical protein HOY78_45985 [Saccharothrix sp.]|nr:hypothetical protein [Saccharothrix sp.]
MGFGRLTALLVGVAGAVVITASPASAAVNDDHSVTNWDYYNKCQAGRLDFVDYGEGAPGGGMNDDYLVVRDTCANGDGVLARVYRNDVLLGAKYHGGGNNTSVVWDPFGNVVANDIIRMQICSADGPDDYSGFECQETTFRSVDG